MPKRRHIIFAILLILLSVATFSNTLKNSFMWDDEDAILEDSYIKSPKNIPFFFSSRYWKSAFLSEGRESIRIMNVIYRPVVAVSFALDYSVWKLDARGYHITNAALHVCNVLLIYLFVLTLLSGARGAAYTAFIAAALFASHPVHTESVNWVKNRSDLFCLVFYLSSLIVFVNESLKRAAHRRALYYAAALALFALALLSKAIAVTLPLIMVLYIFLLFPKTERRPAATRILPFFALAVFFFLFSRYMLGTIGQEVGGAEIGLYSHVMAVLKTLGIYAGLLVLPVNLNAERLFDIPVSFFEPAVISSAGLLSMVIVLAVILYRSGPSKDRGLFLFALLWIFITLLPVSNIIFLHSRPIAEQRLYIPSVGFCLFLSLCVNALYSLEPQRIYTRLLKALAVLLSAAIILFYSVETVKRNSIWRDPVTFWSETTASSPESGRAHNNLGTTFEKAGRNDEAIAAYERAIEIDPYDFKAHNNLGIMYRKTKKAAEAISEFERAIAVDPSYAEAHNNLGAALYDELGQDDKAAASFRKAIEFDPLDPKAYCNLGGLLYKESGLSDEGIRLCKKAIELKPDYTEAHCYLAEIYAATGRYDESAEEYEEAIKIDPKNAVAHNVLGALIYNTQPDRMDEAMKRFLRAIELKPDMADAYYNFGLILVASGLYEDAVSSCQKAIELKPVYAGAYNTMGVAYRHMGQYEKAVESLIKAIELEPGDAAGHNNLALTYYHDLKEIDKAEYHWNEVLKIDPDNETAKKYLSEIKNGRE